MRRRPLRRHAADNVPQAHRVQFRVILALAVAVPVAGILTAGPPTGDPGRDITEPGSAALPSGFTTPVVVQIGQPTDPAALPPVVVEAHGSDPAQGAAPSAAAPPYQDAQGSHPLPAPAPVAPPIAEPAEAAEGGDAAITHDTTAPPSYPPAAPHPSPTPSPSPDEPGGGPLGEALDAVPIGGD